MAANVAGSLRIESAASWHWRAAILVAALLVAGCETSLVADGRRRDAGDHRLLAVCTTGMVADLVRGVGGEQVRVVPLMGPGVDPHLYTATPRDVDALNEAQAIFYSGLHLEGRLTDVFQRMGKHKPVFAVTDDIPRERLLEVSPGVFDPHIWFDVGLWSSGIEAVRQALSEVDPDHAESYAARAARLAESYRALDEYCRQQIAAIPAERRVLVTAHDAFHYFGRAYGMEVRSIQGISTESEASVRQVNALVDFIARRGIKAVFVEHSINERNMHALIEGCQAHGHAVAIGGELFSDALGPSGSSAGDYPGMVRANVDTMVQALR